MTTPFDSGLRNRRSIPWASIPILDPEQFGADVSLAVDAGARVVALFGVPDGDERCRLVAVLADDTRALLGILTTRVRDAYRALTPACPQVHLFEREIWEQCGVIPRGHPWLRPVRRHAPDHATFDAVPAPDREAYDFPIVTGEDVHEVAVGPVHAGIIEPGHFRFQAFGEEVLALEIVLGYQHRGVERLFETCPRERCVAIAESIAGDTVIGHTGAYCGALEALARARKTARAQTLRAIALELERLSNHIGDLGAIGGDIAYYPAAAYCGRLRGECLNLLLALTGNRFGRGMIRPGGVRFDLTPPMAAEFRERLVTLRTDVDAVLDLMLRTSSVQARLEGVGAITHAQCVELGFVGPVARAAETPRDVRHDHPYGAYRFAHVPVATAWGGDVFARALVRRVEIAQSLDFVLEQLAHLPAGNTLVPCGPLAGNEIAVSMEEGWRGEIVHVVLTDPDGRIQRHKVVDPSFHNWTALMGAMPGNDISDFPLCNKSFNLSYAGHDL